MKKYISIIMSVFLMAVLLVSCGSNQDITKKEKEDKIHIVTTIFPEYDWVREIVGENSNVEITMLLDNGVDLHSYQPTADDLVKVSQADMFIYVGGESDEWVENALKQAENKKMVAINLLDVLGDSVKEEEVVEGMEKEEEEKEDDAPEYDEHVWLSLKNSEVFCQKIADNLSKIDSKNSEAYQANVKSYIEKLNSLDKQYEDAVSKGTHKTILFGDRFPFRYMVDDYGINYYAAFVGCSAESEVSFDTITFLSNKLDELGLSSILQIESADGKIAKTINSNTQNKNYEILTLDSMQSTTSADVKAGKTYFSTMQSNLETLKKAIK